MATTAAAKIEETAPVEIIRPIEVNPKLVQLNTAGFAWRELLVRMPPDSTQDDLRTPGLWARCQRVAVSSLMKFDHLFVLAHDESWAANCIVTAASGLDATVIIQKIGSFREPDERLFTDGTHEVFWCGHGYSVKRVSDGSTIGSKAYSTQAQARAAIATLTPTSVVR